MGSEEGVGGLHVADALEGQVVGFSVSISPLTHPDESSSWGRRSIRGRRARPWGRRLSQVEGAVASTQLPGRRGAHARAGGAAVSAVEHGREGQ